MGGGKGDGAAEPFCWRRLPWRLAILASTASKRRSIAERAIFEADRKPSCVGARLPEGEEEEGGDSGWFPVVLGRLGGEDGESDR